VDPQREGVDAGAKAAAALVFKEQKKTDPRSSDAINQHDGMFWVVEGQPWSLDGPDRHKVLRVVCLCRQPALGCSCQ